MRGLERHHERRLGANSCSPSETSAQVSNVSSSWMRRHHHHLHATRHWSLASLGGHWCALLLLITLATCQWPAPTFCLEEDAQIMTPAANLAKAIIKTVTLGVPLEVNVDTSGIVKNFAYFTWRTGFPMTMPSGFMQKAQDFYNRIRARVERARVDDVERKSLVGLRADLDAIVDGIVERVRQSPDGLYTDYLQARVGNGSLPLEDACTRVGVQLKAYGVDLSNYRDIAGAVLGIPVMPSVASAVMNVASLGQSSLGVMHNLTSSALGGPLNLTSNLLSRVPGANVVASSSQMIPFGGVLFGNRRALDQQPALY